MYLHTYTNFSSRLLLVILLEYMVTLVLSRLCWLRNVSKWMIRRWMSENRASHEHNTIILKVTQAYVMMKLECVDVDLSSRISSTCKYSITFANFFIALFIYGILYYLTYSPLSNKRGYRISVTGKQIIWSSIVEGENISNKREKVWNWSKSMQNSTF